MSASLSEYLRVCLSVLANNGSQVTLGLNRLKSVDRDYPFCLSLLVRKCQEEMYQLLVELTTKKTAKSGERGDNDILLGLDGMGYCV